jgi:hypothetical protein
MTHRRGSWEYHLILGLEPGATMREIKQAHRALVKKWHPDQFSQDRHLQQLAENKLKEINEAYTALSNPGLGSYRRYGRPSAGQQTRRPGSAADSQAWSATAGPFHYQSSYYRARHAPGASRRRAPYASTFAAYASGGAQARAQVPHWAILLLMFFAFVMMNTVTSSVLNGFSSHNYAAAPVRSGALPPRANFIPIVTMSEEKELRETKQHEPKAAAVAGVPVPPILSDPTLHEKETPRVQRHASSQKKISAPQDPPAVK